MEKRYNFKDYTDIIAALRSEGGCPWDKAQTHESLKTCLINEAVETVAAVNIHSQTGDGENLCEELGDLLLQVVLQSRIAEEEGLFTIEDVIQKAAEKMIRRHPHVFSNQAADSTDAIRQNWEEIKKQEKSGKSEAQKKFQKDCERDAQREVIEHLQMSVKRL